MKNKRVFHHFNKCEEYQSNMWKACLPNEKNKLIEAARELMININDFYNAMLKVIKEWVYSCESNFTASSINHQAWIGHAACAIAVNSPEDITRLAWRTLTQEQQDKANEAADKAIAVWKGNYNA